MTMVDFLIENQDPEYVLYFRKICGIQKLYSCFLMQAEDDVPQFVMENVNYTVGTDGKYAFQSWKAPGNHGFATTDCLLSLMQDSRMLCMVTGLTTLNIVNIMKTLFTVHTQCSSRRCFGRIDFNYPIIPGDQAIRDTEDVPWWGIYMTSAEVNLYLAEFALLGATLPNASAYFNRALDASVRNYTDWQLIIKYHIMVPLIGYDLMRTY